MKVNKAMEYYAFWALTLFEMIKLLRRKVKFTHFWVYTIHKMIKLWALRPVMDSFYSSRLMYSLQRKQMSAWAFKAKDGLFDATINTTLSCGTDCPIRYNSIIWLYLWTTLPGRVKDT